VVSFDRIAMPTVVVLCLARLAAADSRRDWVDVADQIPDAR
jgi:hypothetical protein